MKAALSPEQVAKYESDGYLVVQDLMSESEIDNFIEDANQPKTPEWKALGLRKHTADSHWNSIAAHPRTSAIVRQLMNGNPRIVQTMYMAKSQKGDTGVALHQDTHYIRNEPNTLMACWVAMSDTDKNNGGLCVVPGSHGRPLYETQLPSDDTQHASWEQVYEMSDPEGQKWDEPMHSHEVQGLDSEEIVYLTVPKGGGVFFTGMTIHGSFANATSDRPRLAFATHYVKEDTWVYRADIQDTVPV